jgi:protein-L-isoaspartate(D-aspartate) O-methyltransferase
MPYTDFISVLHKKTTRDYLGRVNEFPKAEAAKLARQFGKDYWDGDRKVGYGGMRYDGRWRVVAENMARHYGLKAGDRSFCFMSSPRPCPGLKYAAWTFRLMALRTRRRK